MHERYWLFPRNGIYYIEDQTPGKQSSLRTRDKGVARRLLDARNQAFQQPALNMAMARAYLIGSSSEMTTRTWTAVLDEMEAGYEGSTLRRFRIVRRSAPFLLLADLPLLETKSEDFLRVLRHPKAGNSTNKYCGSSITGHWTSDGWYRRSWLGRCGRRFGRSIRRRLRGRSIAGWWNGRPIRSSGSFMKCCG